LACIKPRRALGNRPARPGRPGTPWSQGAGGWVRTNSTTAGNRSPPLPVSHLADRIQQLGLGRRGGHLPIEQTRLAVGRSHEVGPIAEAVGKTHAVQPHSLHGTVVELSRASGHHNHGLLVVSGAVDQFGDRRASGQPRSETPTGAVPAPPAPGGRRPGIPTGIPGTIIPVAAASPVGVPAIDIAIVEVVVDIDILLQSVVIKVSAFVGAPLIVFPGGPLLQGGATVGAVVRVIALVAALPAIHGPAAVIARAAEVVAAKATAAPHAHAATATTAAASGEGRRWAEAREDAEQRQADQEQGAGGRSWHRQRRQGALPSSAADL